MTAERTPLEVAQAYVDAVKAADTDALRALFAPDAVLVSERAGVMRGHDAIAEFYGGIVLRSGMSPQLGPPLIVGNRLAVEIRLPEEGKGAQRLSDFFTVEHGLITRLSVYTAGYADSATDPGELE